MTTLHPAETDELKAHVERAAKARREGVKLLHDRRDGRHYATSATTPGVRYYVTLVSCTCPGFINHGHCKHHSALVIAHLVQEHGPEPSGMTVVRNTNGVQLGMTYQHPRGWWTTLVTTADGNHKINDRGSEAAAVNAIWEYADRHSLPVGPVAVPRDDAGQIDPLAA